MAPDTIAELLELADRCEAAPHQDRALNVTISNAIGDQFARAYTSSLDAAEALVPTAPFPELRPGTWWWSVNSLGCDAHVAYENGDSAIPEYSARAATPALALCAAALRARATVPA